MSKTSRAILPQIAVLLLLPSIALAENLSLSSPDKAIQLSIAIDKSLSISLSKNDRRLIQPSKISLTLQNKDGLSNEVLGKEPKIINTARRSVNNTLKPVVKEKRSHINEHYEEVHIDFEGHYALTFRAYNEGVAYRWETSLPGQIIIQDEEVNFQFSPDDMIYLAKDKSFRSNYEKPYTHHSIAKLTKETFGLLPALVETTQGPKVLIAEADLEAYPGLWLQGNETQKGKSSGLSSKFPGYPLKKTGKGHVLKRANHIAKTQGTRTFPWRILAVAEEDKDLISNQLVYLLAKPLQIGDTSWIEPGQMILDWWARRNIFGVDFDAGVNTETMKYFIDFCAEFGIRYFLADEGWSKSRREVLSLNPDLDFEAVTAYAKEKNVGIFLWLHWQGLNDDMENILDQFAAWGVKGIKVDFMDRDDQEMVEFYHRVARESAERELLVNFHGAYKPAGLRRAYPNVLTREGVIEFEWNGVSDKANPELHTTLPFIRMVAGPLDYIPGTLNNTQKSHFHPDRDRPAGQGTRAHSFALAVIFESPMQMIPDSPSDYYREAESTRFLTEIPVEWDETVALDAKIGEHLVLARRNGESWYAAAITDWSAKTLEIDFSFLGKGEYLCEIIQDGPNADERAIDFQKQFKTVTNKIVLPIKLAPGGGWIAKITKVK